MSKKIKIASILVYIIAAFCILLALLYSFYPTILPYHQEFLGKRHDQLNPKVAIMFIQSLRVVGALLGSLGMSLILLARKLSESWVRWVILCMNVIAFGPILKVTLAVGKTSPWWLMALILILTIISFFLAAPQKAPE